MMNREIKFRAWHNNAKRYMEDLCLYLDSGELGDVSECFHNLESREDYILEQYTGLKDKNGKEIYEGDILQTSESDGVWSDQKNGVVVSDIRHPFGNAHLFEVIGNVHEGIFKDKSTTNE